MHMPASTRLHAEPDLLGRFFAEFLDEAAFAEFRRVERLFSDLKGQGATVSGYPLIRPSDCADITAGLRTVFDQAMGRFRTADPRVVDRFEALIREFVAYVRNLYPTESTGALILHAEVLLFMGDADGTVALLEHLVRRPYAVVDNLDHCSEMVWLFAKAHLQRGTGDEIGICFAAFGAWLCGQPRGPAAPGVANRIAHFAAVTPGSPGLRAGLIRWSSGRLLRTRRGHNTIPGFLWARCMAAFYLTLSVLCLLLLARRQKWGMPYHLERNQRGTTLVARAMGGIGDLLMMEPGLEALARKQGAPVDMAIPRKFFAVFANNPQIRTIDIDGPPIDLRQYRKLANLSMCPASRYESRHRPRIRKGRVETFARGMGINRKLLRRQGWHINQFIDEVTSARCDEFLRSLGFERRIIGVQPFSRDDYKDYAQIGPTIERLALKYDVLVFHHVADGLPTGPGIANTAGLPLATSLALVSRVEAMVSVDSAFLHAAAAYDTPVIALFGPTDARTLTRHHRNVEIVWNAAEFSCVPCWRNQDAPCQLTGLLGPSPCLSGIVPERIIQAVDRAMGAA